MNLPAFILLATLFLVLLIGVTVFVKYFALPARKLERTLTHVIEKIQILSVDHKWDLTSCFIEDTSLSQIWLEYRGSLHKETAIGRASQGPIVVAVHSTQPAEVFFSTQAVVDHRIHTEFFRHLPGLFTGVGIIGTFTGLIMGLQNFEISQNPDVIRRSLSALLTGVSHAFYASAGAIVLAMLATAVEKFYVNRLYGLVQRLGRLIDATFEAGSGEEYLSRLTLAVEEASRQTKTHKDDLVAELKKILTDLSDRQIAASRLNLMDLGRLLTGAAGPISREPSGAAPKLQADVLAGLHRRLKDMAAPGPGQAGAGDEAPEFMHQLRTVAGDLHDETDASLRTLTQTLDEASRSFSRMAAMSQDPEAASIGAARCLDLVKGDYGAARQAAAVMASAVADLLELSSRDFRATTDMAERLGSVIERLAEAKSEADRRLASAAEALEASRREFVNSLKLTIIEANTDVNRELTEATAVLRGAIESLDPAPPISARGARGR